MWTRSRRLARRPAPPGARAVSHRHDTPPDGWEVVDSSWAERLGVRIDTAVLHLADAAARGTSRRAFLAGAGGLSAAAVTFAGRRLVWNTPTAEAGHQIFNCNNLDSGNPGACGPSAPCLEEHCLAHSDDLGGKSLCRNALAAVVWQRYTEGICVGADDHSCWRENCCKEYGGIAMCCDCCTNENRGSGSCTSCEDHTRYKCICDGRRQNC